MNWLKIVQLFFLTSIHAAFRTAIVGLQTLKIG